MAPMEAAVRVWYEEKNDKNIITVLSPTKETKFCRDNMDPDSLTPVSVEIMKGRLGFRRGKLLEDIQGLYNGRYKISLTESGTYIIQHQKWATPLGLTPSPEDLMPVHNGPGKIRPAGIESKPLPKKAYAHIQMQQGSILSKLQCSLEVGMMTPEEQLKGFVYATYQRCYLSPTETENNHARIEGVSLIIEDLRDSTKKYKFDSSEVRSLNMLTIRRAATQAVLLRTGFYLTSDQMKLINASPGPGGMIEVDQIGQTYFLRPVGPMTIHTTEGRSKHIVMYHLDRYRPGHMNPFGNKVPETKTETRKGKDRNERLFQDLPLCSNAWDTFMLLQNKQITTLDGVLEDGLKKIETVSNVSIDSIGSGISGISGISDIKDLQEIKGLSGISAILDSED